MADSTYISKNLTREQLRFMKLLNDHEILYFRMEEVEARLEQKFTNLNEVLENLVDKGLLARIERGKYTLGEFRDLPVLACYMVRDGILAYWSALHHHGLTERFPNLLFVKTAHRKRQATLFGTSVRFVTVHPRKMTGQQAVGYGDRQYFVSDPESTLLECFDQPKYAGEYPDLISAFFKADINADKLIAYAGIYNNLSIIKRMGLLAELTRKKELVPFIEFAHKNRGKEYSLFDPGGPDTGSYIADWQLRMNMTVEDILDITQNPY
ncbi:MAG: hypothetical protein WBP41_13075 [Saprospiraceae bacterium]